MSYTAEQVGIEIVRAAQPWLDTHEIASNATWSGPNDLTFRQKMKEVGHQPGWAYCMSFAKACWIDGYRAVGASKHTIALLQNLFTPSVIQTYDHVKHMVIQRQPPVGSLMLMRLGGTSKGHAGLVILGATKTFVTIEANTTPGVAKAAGGEREGDGIYIKPPKALDFTPRPTGLWLLGFLPPLDEAAIDGLRRPT